VEELPPEEVIAAHLELGLPGPLERMETPGTDCTTALMSVMPRSCRSTPVSAVIADGCRLDG